MKKDIRFEFNLSFLITLCIYIALVVLASISIKSINSLVARVDSLEARMSFLEENIGLISGEVIGKSFRTPSSYPDGYYIILEDDTKITLCSIEDHKRVYLIHSVKVLPKTLGETNPENTCYYIIELTDTYN